MAIVVGSSFNSGPIVFYRQIVPGDMGNWESLIIATDAWRILNHHLIKASWERIEIAGTNINDELVHIVFYPETQNAALNIIYADGRTWQISPNQGSITSVQHPNGALDLFAITKPRIPLPSDSDVIIHRDVNGDLLHFYRKSETTLWEVENITQIVGGNAYLDPRTSLYACQQKNTTKVFGVRWPGELLEFKYGPPKCRIFRRLPSWKFSNVSSMVITIPEVDAGSQWLFQSPIYKISWNNEDIDIFGLTGLTGEELHHLSYRNKKWYSHNLSRYRYNAHIPNPNITITSTGSIQHVILSGEGGQIIRFIRAGDSNNWSHEVLQERITSPEKYRIHHLLTAIGKLDELHILGFNITGLNDLTHFVYRNNGRPWHTSLDYFVWSAGSVSSNDFKYVPKKKWLDEDGDELLGHAVWGLFTTDRTELWCPVFGINKGPGIRAGVLVHESTHHHFHNIQHDDDDDQDRWFHHTLGEIELLDQDNPDHIHSPYQIEAEFLADLSQFPVWWVPFIIRQNAQNTAQWILDNKFRNDPGWVIGEPRPL